MFVEDKAEGEPQEVSVRAFRDFAATKDPKEGFRYIDNETCACAQFAKSIGRFAEWQRERSQYGSEWAKLNNFAALAIGRNAHLTSVGGILDLGHNFGDLVKVLDKELANA